MARDIAGMCFELLCDTYYILCMNLLLARVRNGSIGTDWPTNRPQTSKYRNNRLDFCDNIHLFVVFFSTKTSLCTTSHVRTDGETG